ncbi:MAG: slipin family protein [Candidatus Fervidibacter sp.]|uniref:slipin family protein n=1 Tax=Candidatus Fervidibacter sp. TaxID=3100871 RepID=UPI00404A3F87
MPKELTIQLIAFVIVVALVLISQAIKIVQEWERGVIFRLGRFVRMVGPGIQFIIPFIERMIKVDIRVFAVDVPKQEIITKDNVTVRVNAVVYFRVVDPMAALVRVENYLYATQQVSQTTLRDVIGQSELDELLAHREELNQRLQRIIDTTTDPWGIKVDIVAIKDVELPDAMKRAMARQAEAERERRAKVIHAQGEYQAAETLAQAAEIMGRHPGSLQLRFLQTLTEVATERSTIVVMPVPIDILSAFIADRRRTETIPPS